MSVVPPTSAQDAATLADWHLRYALDRITGDGRLYHPGFNSHLTAARIQLAAALKLGTPENDQVTLEAA